MLQYEIIIKGRVQGVGFRFFVQQKASEIGIKGWVKNRNDGSVLVMAQGDEKDLETFFNFLNMGPALARVDQLSKNKMDTLSDFPDFRVRY